MNVGNYMHVIAKIINYNRLYTKIFNQCKYELTQIRQKNQEMT